MLFSFLYSFFLTELDVVALEERLDELDLLGAEQEVHGGHVARHPGHWCPALHTVLCIRIRSTQVFGSFCFSVKASLCRLTLTDGVQGVQLGVADRQSAEHLVAVIVHPPLLLLQVLFHVLLHVN